jgi:hypothetical protein
MGVRDEDNGEGGCSELQAKAAGLSVKDGTVLPDTEASSLSARQSGPPMQQCSV